VTIWSSDHLSDQITDADETCRSSEISINLIIIIVFLQTYSYFCYILTSFLMLLCCILDVYLSFLFVCTESLAHVSDPTSRKFIRWLLFQMFIYIYTNQSIRKSNSLKVFESKPKGLDNKIGHGNLCLREIVIICNNVHS
jgi:hypothetical protein